MRRTPCALWIAAAVGSLAACDRTRDVADTPTAGDIAGPEAEAPPPKASIMRPEVLAETRPAPPAPDPIQRRVMFDVASANLSERARAALDDLLQTEGMAEGHWTLTLTGRTDPSGNAEANLRLSRQRAEAVRDHLIEGGVPPERIQIAAAGEPEGQTPPDDEDALAGARRVDVRAEPVMVASETTE